MAYWKWLVGERDPFTEMEWPSPGEWGEPQEPRVNEMGYQVSSGSMVCSQIPSALLPADLWEVEVDGLHHRVDGCVAFERARLVTKLGSLSPDVAFSVASGWVTILYRLLLFEGDQDIHARTVAKRAQPHVEALERIVQGHPEAGDEALVGEATWPPLLYAWRSRDPAPKIAWSWAKSLPIHCASKEARIEMAQVLSEHLTREEQ